MLTQAEVTQAKLYATGEWAVLSYDPDTQITVWVRKEGTGSKGFLLRFRETQPVADILEHNRARASMWSGWKSDQNAKRGAVVTSIPNTVWNDMMRQCGSDGAEYDRKKFKRLINDPDYAKLRLVSGKL